MNSRRKADLQITDKNRVQSKAEKKINNTRDLITAGILVAALIIIVIILITTIF